MSENLDSLIQRVESDILQREAIVKKDRFQKSKGPAVAVAFVIWVAAIVLGALQFETVVSLFSVNIESNIERDLENILNSAAASLRSYEIESGVLPAILPNPAIRGLVKYERQSDNRYRLSATVNNVSIVLDSSMDRPIRESSTN